MQSDFDVRVDRRNMASIREMMTPKEVKEAGLISVWGAEFEFKMPSFIIDAIKEWADQGLIAYSYADQAYLDIVKNWMELHRNWHIETDWIVPTYGLTFSMGTICRAFTKPGEGVICMNPVYHRTMEPVVQNNRVYVDCPLLFNGQEYTIDYDRLESAMVDPNNKILTFCNPHNPTGKVWGRKELERIAALALKYNVIVYSDEIFADLTFEGVEMLTFSQVTDKPLKWIVATSIGKTYSITGIGQANFIIEDKELREAFIRQRDIDHYGSFDPLMRTAYFAGYTEQGSQWIKEMMNYCYKNYELIHQCLKENIPQIRVIKPQGTYILWLDCRMLELGDEEAYKDFFKKAKFMCDSGTTYGSQPGFVRMNIAAPRADIMALLEVLVEAVSIKHMEGR